MTHVGQDTLEAECEGRLTQYFNFTGVGKLALLVNCL